MLNAISCKAQSHTIKPLEEKGLMCVDILLNGQPTRLMSNTGDTHYFIDMPKIKRLRPPIEKSSNQLIVYPDQLKAI